MPNIPQIADKVPLMFRSQIPGRCQLQRITKEPPQDSQRWASEWTDKIYPHSPNFGTAVQTNTYTFNWRFVTNGGQDDGIIRPVIGAFGLPFYPGSSMKGAFRQACQQLAPTKLEIYCGNDELPGCLQFHGGYPTSNDWTESLVDIVHPQQGWQVKVLDTTDKPSGESGFALISLYRPTIKFGISTSNPPQTDWQQVWQIWEKALGEGIGCRVSSGYGLATTCVSADQEPRIIPTGGTLLYRAYLKGQGQASQLVGTDKGEFRPNIFRAALRGHALRIFGGLTDAKTAENIVGNLFGNVTGQGTVGLLKMNFRQSSLTLGQFSDGYDEPTYKVTGELRWLLAHSLSPEKHAALQKLLRDLTRFALLLGGFGKSWRRSDHRLFYPEYYQGENSKPLIGCHWEWDKNSIVKENKVTSLAGVTASIHRVRQTAIEWLQLYHITPQLGVASWREAWHPEQVQVWGRKTTEGVEDSEAIPWLHQPYQRRDNRLKIPEKSIYRSSLTGESVGCISRLWQRMYPIIIVRPNPDNPDKPSIKKTNEFLELLTVFPDQEPRTIEFLEFLQSHPGGFEKLWPQ